VDPTSPGHEAFLAVSWRGEYMNYDFGIDLQGVILQFGGWAEVNTVHCEMRTFSVWRRIVTGTHKQRLIE
jgi:hypothetical protein